LSYYLKILLYTYLYNKMLILEYCKINQIKCLPIKLDIVNGKKIYLNYTVHGDESKFSDGHFNFNIGNFKNLSLEECFNFCEKYKNETAWFGVDCSETQQLDIDDTSGKYWNSTLCKKFANLPYFLSATKKMPHYFIKTEWTNGKQNNNAMKFDDGSICAHDILYGNAWSYAKNDSQIINANASNIFDDWDMESTASCSSSSYSEDEECNEQATNVITNSINEQIVNLIGLKYLDDYSSWTKIVWAMRNENYSEEFAMKISKKSKKFDIKVFTKLWHRDNYEGINLVKQGTLNYYAKLSNPKGYELIYINKYLANLDVFDEGLLKDYFISINADSIVAIKKKSNLFVFYKNNWVEDDGGVLVQNMLFETIKSMYVLVIETLFEQLKNDPKNKTLSEQMATITKLNHTYGNKNNKNIYSLVFNELKANAQEEDIFDTNRYIFSFTNKSYDLKNNVWFEPTKFDYILTTCNKEWREPTQQQKSKIKELFESIFPDENVRKAYTSILRSGLTGIRHEYFIIATGGGRNGKGLINELMNYLLGDYSGTLHLSLLTKEIKSGANTELRSLHKKRLIIASEPEEGHAEKLRCSNIKALTGNETHKARGLYEKDDITKIMGTFIMECNTKPEISGKKDTAILDRMIIIPFTMTFTDDKELLENEPSKYKLKNPLYKEESFKQEHYCALFNYLITEYTTNDLYIPQACKKLGADYLLDKDEFANWFLDVYKEGPDDEYSLITIKDLHAKYMEMNKGKMSVVESRTMTCKKFIEMIKDHILLKKHFIEQNTYRYKKQQKRQAIWGYQLIGEDKDEEE
jgi:phage/plasmid-associated DNA primase